MFTIKNIELNEPHYNDLIIYLYNCCDMFSFNFPNCTGKYGYHVYRENFRQKLDELNPFIINHYFNYEYNDSIRNGGDPYEIFHIAFTENTIWFLMLGLGLYNWVYPNLPEDICFYKKGKCFLKSISHEKRCCIYTDDIYDKLILRKIGLKLIELPHEEAPRISYSLKY